MNRQGWRRLWEPVTLAGALDSADPQGAVVVELDIFADPPQRLADPALRGDLLAFDADLLARGDYRVAFRALQACLARGPRATVADVVAELGADARIFHFNGGAHAWLAAHRDSWSAPTWGAVRAAMAELRALDALQRAEVRLRSLPHRGALPRALEAIGAELWPAMAGGAP